MPRTCTVCMHEERPASDAAFVRGQSMYALAAQYRVSPARRAAVMRLDLSRVQAYRVGRSHLKVIYLPERRVWSMPPASRAPAGSLAGRDVRGWLRAA